MNKIQYTWAKKQAMLLQSMLRTFDYFQLPKAVCDQQEADPIVSTVPQCSELCSFVILHITLLYSTVLYFTELS